MSEGDAIRGYLNDYYNIILFFFLLEPLSCLLDNAVLMDGGEKYSSVLNVIRIAGIFILSYVLAGSFGIKGIALGRYS